MRDRKKKHIIESESVSLVRRISFVVSAGNPMGFDIGQRISTLLKKKTLNMHDIMNPVFDICNFSNYIHEQLIGIVAYKRVFLDLVWTRFKAGGSILSGDIFYNACLENKFL